MKDVANQETERKFLVIGGGPAGLTAAHELSKLGYRATVFEKEHIVGGLARTENCKGFYFDMGGHRFFTKSKEVQKRWQQLLGDDFLRRPRLSRIFYQNKFFHYPLKPINALKGLGIVESVLILLSYFRWQIFPYREEKTFEQWVTNRFGKRLFDTFFKTYTEKVWGIPCSEIQSEWAAQRIKDLSLKKVLINMFRSPGSSINTLIQEFHYPRRGPGMMWNAAKKQVEAYGNDVLLESEVIEIYRTGNCIELIEVLRSGEVETFAGTDFISSMPITEFAKKLNPSPPDNVLKASDRLKYRDFLTVCLIVNEKELFPDNWLYIHDPSVKVGRIQNYKNWSPYMVSDSDKTSLGLEYFCTEGDTLWNLPDSKLVDLGKRELEKIGLARFRDIEEGCVFRVPKSYPIYDSNYQKHLSVLKEFVEGLTNFQTVGRNGLHRYNNQDHAMLTGLFAVRNLLYGENHDLWSINAEQDYHEEINRRDILSEEQGEQVQSERRRYVSIDP